MPCDLQKGPLPSQRPAHTSSMIMARQSPRYLLGKQNKRDTNGLIRQYFPKGRYLATMSKTEIKNAMNRLKHRPRKSLGFRTSDEVFFKVRALLMLALIT